MGSHAVHKFEAEAKKTKQGNAGVEGNKYFSFSSQSYQQPSMVKLNNPIQLHSTQLPNLWEWQNIKSAFTDHRYPQLVLLLLKIAWLIISPPTWLISYAVWIPRFFLASRGRVAELAGVPVTQFV